ncbi:signal peptidase II [Psychroflexus sediminis]|uniref:Lipoprotein signal peptidase n=2 Tax=Psychroflexus sediminis TaxID=470826 RepID=A0A1G7XYE1_9FLAO|nr:signal peptidase II [Psychroflexus sediminis]
MKSQFNKKTIFVFQTKLMSLKKASLFILIILVIDQVSKIYIKTHFMLGEEVRVFDWFRILFVENDGMAWGAEIPGAYGKILLTSFRIIAIGLISYWLWDSVKKNSPKILIICQSLILAGAIGNIIDSVFYGVIFDSSLGQVATLFAEEPYGQLLKGKVVDMLYFPIYNGILPEWIPIWGGERFVFFEPVFNIADTAISTGFGLLLVFNKKAFPKK